MPSSPTTSGIYAIHSAVNDRRYIGSAVSISQRWGEHRTSLRRKAHRNPHLQNAWNKYGEDAFEFMILEECLPELLIEREQFYMDQYSNKYNLAPVAGSSFGIKRSPETRARMSAAQKGLKRSPETRERIRASKIGNKYATGHVKSSEAKARISAAKKGSKMSLETRLKMGEAKRGNKYRQGCDVSPETRAKLSAAAKAQWERKRAVETMVANGAKTDASSKVVPQTKSASL